MQAEASNFPSANAGPVEVTTGCDANTVPGKVTELQAENQGTGAVKLTWGPVDNSACVTGYR
jgi:hypothetical protein